ncbi:MAG: hypothetical protein ACUZ8H_01345, partial [Candidatus Anammoxibacter sp.]
MKKNWMVELESYYKKTRDQYSDDKLIILFDIDGTILDMRYMVMYVLTAFDKYNKTKYFHIQNSSINIEQDHQLIIGILITRFF